MQAQADLLQAPVERYPSADATALGAGALARLGSGVASTPQEAVGDWTPAEVFEPRMTAAEAQERAAAMLAEAGIVLTPSERHVPQTTARWRASGFDAHVAPLSPYEENDPAAVRRAADALRAGNAGLVVMDCIGFRRKTRDEIAALTGAPTLVANLLVARMAAELLGR